MSEEAALDALSGRRLLVDYYRHPVEAGKLGWLHVGAMDIDTDLFLVLDSEEADPDSEIAFEVYDVDDE